MKIFFHFLIAVLIVISSCKEENKNDVVTPIHTASLQIIVFKNDTNNILKPLTDVSIFLYLTDNDRTNNENIKYMGTVNDSGKISFNKLPNEYYYLLASHSTYGTKKLETATPNNSISYEEIDF